MNLNKFLRATPFLIVSAILSYTWYVIITTNFFATVKHQIALGLIITNAIIYFFRFKYGIYFTGLVLILATFNFVAFFPEIIYSSLFIRIAGKEIATPAIQGKSLLLLIFYLVINAGFLIDVYSEYKHNKSNKRNRKIR